MVTSRRMPIILLGWQTWSVVVVVLVVALIAAVYIISQ